MNDGGPAFPCEVRTGIVGAVINDAGREVPEWEGVMAPGMSLRDYFAAAALTGELAAESESFRYRDSDMITREQTIAHKAFKMADAMLAERAKSK